MKNKAIFGLITKIMTMKYINEIECQCFDTTESETLNGLIHKVIEAVVINRKNFISFDSELIMLISKSSISEIENFFKIISHFSLQDKHFTINDKLVEEDIILNWLL